MFNELHKITQFIYIDGLMLVTILNGHFSKEKYYFLGILSFLSSFGVLKKWIFCDFDHSLQKASVCYK